MPPPALLREAGSSGPVAMVKGPGRVTDGVTRRHATTGREARAHPLLAAAERALRRLLESCILDGRLERDVE